MEKFPSPGEDPDLEGGGRGLEPVPHLMREVTVKSGKRET